MKQNLALIFALTATSLSANPLPTADAVFPKPDMAAIRLGQLLFYDPILSGNQTVSCTTCHHPRFATGDGLSLGIGDGGIDLSPDRIAASSTRRTFRNNACLTTPKPS